MGACHYSHPQMYTEAFWMSSAYMEAVDLASKGHQVHMYSFDHVSANERRSAVWRGAVQGAHTQYLSDCVRLMIPKTLL